MEIGAVSNLARETMFLDLESPFPDDFLLQIFISELMTNGPNRSQQLLTPFPKKQAIKKSEQKSAIYYAKGEFNDKKYVKYKFYIIMHIFRDYYSTFTKKRKNYLDDHNNFTKLCKFTTLSWIL